MVVRNLEKELEQNILELPKEIQANTFSHASLTQLLKIPAQCAIIVKSQEFT